MRIILFFLFTVVNSYIMPRSLVIMKNDNCVNQQFNYLKKKIKKLENIKRKIIDLTNDNFKIIKQLIEEDFPEIKTLENEYSTEWDFYNETWRKT
jgi:hypothetical protein